MALVNLDITDSEAIEQLKKEYKNLQIGTVACLSSGFIILLSAPFIVKAKDCPFLRYASLFSGLFCGSVSLVCVKRLEEIEPQYTVIKKAETRTFINKSATSEFTLMKLFEREASAILRPPQPALEPHSQSDLPDNSQPSLSDSQEHSHPGTEDNSQDSPDDSHFAANDAALASTDTPIDRRAERLELLRQLKKNRRTKAQIIERLWGVTEDSEEYSYYAAKLEEMLAELKRVDSES